MTIQNAQQIHVSFQDSINVKASGLNVSSPGNSPNTDGIHITNTQNIKISSSIIGTGILIIKHLKNLKKKITRLGMKFMFFRQIKI